MDVQFKFHVSQAVRDRHGNTGIITMAAINESGTKMYYVETQQTARWENEDHLTE
jgi:hypothetical protein